MQNKKSPAPILIPALASIVFLCTRCDQGPFPEDPVKIPDQSFLEALLEPMVDGNGETVIVDSNGDGIVSYAEAE